MGVQARGVDGITPPHESLDELCDASITELLADHPDGPQFLAGFSGGGIIAYDIAARLAARLGERLDDAFADTDTNQVGS